MEFQKDWGASLVGSGLAPGLPACGPAVALWILVQAEPRTTRVIAFVLLRKEDDPRSLDRGGHFLETGQKSDQASELPLDPGR
jgi:hypothetical protein